MFNHFVRAFFIRNMQNDTNIMKIFEKAFLSSLQSIIVMQGLNEYGVIQSN